MEKSQDDCGSVKQPDRDRSIAKACLDLIGFFPVGDVPGRHEPGSGEIDCRNIFRFIDESGYKDYISLEFSPTGDHSEAVRKTIEIMSF